MDTLIMIVAYYAIAIVVGTSAAMTAMKLKSIVDRKIRTYHKRTKTLKK
jgi:hypothetical protein